MAIVYLLHATKSLDRVLDGMADGEPHGFTHGLADDELVRSDYYMANLLDHQTVFQKARARISRNRSCYNIFIAQLTIDFSSVQDIRL